MNRVLPLLALMLLPAVASAQLIRTGGLENLALNATVTASTCSGPVDSKYGPARAVDGDSNTRWASAADAPPPQWLQIEFGNPVTVNAIVLEQTDLDTIYANAREIELAFSDGSRVEQILQDDPGGQIVRFEPRQTTSLRVTFLSAYELKTYLGIDEVAVFDDPDQVVRALIPPRQRWENPDLTPRGREVHPCVNKTPADVERARQNMERYPFLADYVREVQATADEWLARSDDWILEMLPEAGAAFAYGFTGCPICGAKWGTWGGARCSWDHPRQVTCANGHVLPDADHPDPGTGYVAADGRTHYFIGSWNAWVVEKLQFDALRPLCLTYLLTGDERYAQKAAFILDAIAQIYPECDAGSWDYPSNPPSGRLCRPWYQVARVLIHYADFYDEVFNSPALDEPSLVEGMSRRANIEQNLLLNGAWYCYEQSLKGGLANGEADYIRGALAVGCVLGIDHYVDWALDGPYGIRSMIANNADRDGRYFETSISYALHARDLYITFSEPMINYRSERYPEGVDLYADPKFLSFYFLPGALFDCAGHSPRYGDTGPDPDAAWPRDPVYTPLDYEFAETCYARTGGDTRETFASALAYLAGERGEDIRASMRDRGWLLFHGGDFPAAADTDATRERIAATDFFGQKGMAILRAGEGRGARAALVRYGPSLNHGHFDDLNLNYYALGHEVTYDLGYGLGSTHTQVGWAKQTASHNLVVVDEQRQHWAGSGAGGSLLMVAEMPGLRVLEAEARAAYASQGVEQYQRLVALVGEGAGSYLVDIFRVAGGSQHDYMLHSLDDEVAIEGVEMGAVEPGSLAGPEYEWGRLQGNDGDMKGHPNRPYWGPPPGNGYGFLVDVRRGEAPGPWSATWEIDAGREARLRAVGLPEPGTELITAWAPGIYPHLPRAAYVCARRTGDDLRSSYVTVLEPIERPVAALSVGAPELLSGAQVTGGITKLVGANIALFQANAAGDRMTFAIEVPETDRYVVSVRHYLSPAYGTARLLLDGEPLGEPFRGTAANVGAAPPLELATLELQAGAHEVALEMVAPHAEGGNYWMGLTDLELQPADQAAELAARERIVQAERIDLGEGAVGVRVTGRDGVEDLILSAPDADVRDWGEGIVSAARFAHLRFRDGALLSANVIGGRSVVTPQMDLALEQDAWRGTVVAVDEQAREVVLEMEGAALPEGDALRGAAIYIDNPGYSRNSAYHVEQVTRDGERVRVRVRESTFILGKAVVDGPPVDRVTLTSLVPHPYAQTMARAGSPPETDFFRGKLFTNADGSVATTVRTVGSGQPISIIVDSTAGFDDGDVCYYHDVRPGDSATIFTQVSVQRDPGGAWVASGNAPASVSGR
ncbi:MAG: hypothetical protein GX131_02400 [candidate division WS1 bacterium]|nr:hypothetical protein [candidate division WS1 bacterium]